MAKASPTRHPKAPPHLRPTHHTLPLTASIIAALLSTLYIFWNPPSTDQPSSSRVVESRRHPRRPSGRQLYQGFSRSARCRAAPPPRAAAAPQPRCCRAAAVPPRRRAAVAPACVRGGLPGCHAPAVHNALPATRCMCPPRPPQHVPPWLPQHMSAMDDTARATPGCPQARCHRHTATTHGGRGECPHCGASATAACLLHVLVALWVGLPWLPPSTMAATARLHQGCHAWHNPANPWPLQHAPPHQHHAAM